MAHYLVLDKAYKLISHLRDSGVLVNKTVEYNHAPHSKVCTGIDIIDTETKHRLWIDLFNPQIYDFLRKKPELIQRAFENMEKMPEDLLSHATLDVMPAPPPEDWVLEYNIFSITKRLRIPAHEAYGKYSLSLTYDFINNKISTLKWDYPFELMAYFDYKELKAFGKVVVEKAERIYNEFLDDKHRWMYAYRKVIF